MTPELIEKALKLTWKTMDEMWQIDACLYDWTPISLFSSEKFCYYLLSPEFIEKYKTKVPMAMEKPNLVCYIVAEAIYEHQKWNPEPLIQLLSKI